MKRIAIIVSLLSIVVSANSQSIEQALKLLNQNKRTEAKNALIALEKDAATLRDAALGMTILEISNEHYDIAFDHFQRFFNAEAEPYAYVYALWNTGIFSTDSKGDNVKRFMENILNDKRADPTMKAMAYSNLANRYMGRNELDKAKEYWGKMGDVKKGWGTIGVFDNTSSSGFSKDHGVLAHPEAGFTFKNKYGANVNWFTIPDARNDRWVDMEYHYSTYNSIIYAQTYLFGEADVDAIMRFGVSGSFKIWINDFLVAQEAEERNTDLDVYNYKVKLAKGYNRILIQLGCSDIDRSNFMLRFTGLNGEPMNLYATPSQQSYTKAKPYDVTPVPLFAERYFEERLLKTPGSFLDKYCLLNVYNHNDKRYDSRRLAAELKKMEPVSTLVSEKLTESYSRDENNTDLTKEIEFVKTNDPESLYALMLLYSDAIKKEDHKEAQRLLDRRMELYGKNEDTELKTLDLLVKLKENEKLLKEVEVAYKTYPDDRRFVSIQYNIVQSVTKNNKQANAILETYLKKHYDADFYTTISDNLMELGKKDDAMKILKRLVDDKPYAVGWYNSISKKYFEMQDYQSALDWQMKAIERAPYLGDMHYSKALILDIMRRKDEAIASLKRTIELSPNNYEARKKLRQLQGKKDLFEACKSEDINALAKANITQSDYPNENSVYLLNDKQQLVYPENGASEEKNEILIKILNPSGIEEWKEVSLSYNSYTQRLIVDKAELLKKDGSKVQAETNDDQVVFTSLEVGDVLHMSYKLESSSYGKLSEHFWEEFTFNGGKPVKISRFSLITPKERKFQYKMYNTTIQPVITDVDEYRLHVWEKKDNPGVTGEPYMPPFTDVSERVVVTSIPDWNYVANWYSDVSSIKTKGDFEVKEKAKELFANKKGLTDIQKAITIYEYIENNYNYSNVPFLHSALTPQRASRTIVTKLGDCKDLSTLFVALCKEVGLNANLVLVDTRNNGEFNLDLPTIGFNHCVAQFKTGDKNYFIELTDKHLPFGALSSNDLNANALLIPKDGELATNAKLIKLNTPNRPENFIDRQSELVFKGTVAEMVRKSKRIGAEASGSRANNKDVGIEDRNNTMLKSLGSEFNKKVSLVSYDITHLDDLKDTVETICKFKVENYSSELVGMQIFKLPWTDSYSTQDFSSLEKRKFPFDIWSFSSTQRDREVMSITLPPGKKLIEAPKNVVLSCPAMSYKLSFEIKPDKIIATREVKYLKDRFPVEEYAAFKDFIAKMSEADNKQFGFK